MRNHLQTVLAFDDIPVFWKRKQGDDYEAYIVYTLSDDNEEIYADDEPIIKSAHFIVRYYYRSDLANSISGRERIFSREDEIVTTLKNAGYTLPYGFYDVGDIDDIGFETTVFECYFWRVTDFEH